jgi:hypothetical protein
MHLFQVRSLSELTSIVQKLQKSNNGVISPSSFSRLGQIDHLEHKCANKDFLIRTLADTVRTDLSANSVVRRLREATFKPSYLVRGIDFNLESLCKFIEVATAAAIADAASSVTDEENRKKEAVRLELKLIYMESNVYQMCYIRSGVRTELSGVSRPCQVLARPSCFRLSCHLRASRQCSRKQTHNAESSYDASDSREVVHQQLRRLRNHPHAALPREPSRDAQSGLRQPPRSLEPARRGQGRHRICSKNSKAAFITYLGTFTFSLSCQIYVDGHLHQRAGNASRTKAIVHGIALMDACGDKQPISITIGIESQKEEKEEKKIVSDRKHITVTLDVLRELERRKKTPPPIPRKL